MANPKQVEVDQRLYTIMRRIYARYTGEQLAAVLAHIRAEIEEEKALLKIKEDLKRLKAEAKEKGIIE